jgi:adenylate cyclase
MATEIERKFLVDRLPDAAELGAGVAMRQGYVAEEDGVAVRVRITDDEARLTIKAGDGVSRTEVELPLDVDEAESLWPFSEGRRITKRRHRVALAGGHVAEVDVYAGPLDGLLTVEVEFESDEDAGAFVPPSWFGREVTTEPGWSNLSLSRDGIPR